MRDTTNNFFSFKKHEITSGPPHALISLHAPTEPQQREESEILIWLVANHPLLISILLLSHTRPGSLVRRAAFPCSNNENKSWRLLSHLSATDRYNPAALTDPGHFSGKQS